MKKFCLPENCPLFYDIDKNDLDTLLACLAGWEKQYAKGEIILHEGDALTAVGIVVSGCVHIVKEDYFGNRNIIAEIHEGGLFGEAFVCAEADASPVTVFAGMDSNILHVDYNRIIKTCPSACTFHTLLVRNMLRILAKKNMSLLDKLEHITRRTTQEKVLSYLSEQAKQQGVNPFVISLNRQELADYLSVERSALSAELSKLRDEGIIKFRKNKFELLSMP